MQRFFVCGHKKQSLFPVHRGYLNIALINDVELARNFSIVYVIMSKKVHENTDRTR